MKRLIIILMAAAVMAAGLMVSSCKDEKTAGDAAVEKQENLDQAAAPEMKEPALSAPEAAAPPPAVVAKVNGQEISGAALEQTISEIQQQREFQSHVSGETLPEKDIAAMRQEALDGLIFMELAYQFAKTQPQLAVNDEEITELVTKLKDELKTEQAFSDYLQKFQLTEESLRQKVERKLLLKKTFEQEVEAKAVVSDEEARQEYEKEKDFFTIPARIEVEAILVPLTLAHHNKEKTKMVAEDYAAELKEKKSTADIVAKTGVTIRAATIDKVLDADLYKQVADLEPMEVSPVIEKDGAYHIFLIKNKIADQPVPFEETKDWFLRKAKQERAKAWYEELKKDATVEVMTETGSGER